MDFPFLHVLDFNYMIVQLNKENWRKYLRQDNPVAAALLSKMGYNDDEKVEIKVEFLNMILKLQLDPARLSLIMGFFDTYLNLSPEEEEKVLERVKAMSARDADKVMEIMNSYERRGWEQGIKEGKLESKQEGKQEGKQEAIRMVVKRMREKGKTVQEISELIGLELEEIEKL